MKFLLRKLLLGLATSFSCDEWMYGKLLQKYIKDQIYSPSQDLIVSDQNVRMKISGYMMIVGCLRKWNLFKSDDFQMDVCKIIFAYYHNHGLHKIDGNDTKHNSI